MLYDRDEHGEFLHAYTDGFHDRFFFEVVQRIGGYGGFGAANASMRISAQLQQRRSGRRSLLMCRSQANNQAGGPMFLSLPDLNCHVSVQGPPGGAPLLMLHSLGTDLRVWDAQAEAFAGSFRVIRPDMRGHGLTTVTPGPYSIADLARDAIAVLDALAIGKAYVVGLSIGGMIAQSLAAQAPDRVASLLLVDTAMTIPPRTLWQERAAIVRAQGIAPIADAVMARWVTPEFMGAPAAQGLRTMLLRTPPEGYAAAAEAVAVADLTDSTSRLRVPTLVLVGEHDGATPPEAAQALARAIPNARVEIITGAAHIPNDE